MEGTDRALKGKSCAEAKGRNWKGVEGEGQKDVQMAQVLLPEEWKLHTDSWAFLQCCLLIPPVKASAKNHQ